MKVKELIEILQNQDPKADVLIYTKTNNLGLLDDLESVCLNADAVQLNGDSTND